MASINTKFNFAKEVGYGSAFDKLIEFAEDYLSHAQLVKKGTNLSPGHGLFTEKATLKEKHEMAKGLLFDAVVEMSGTPYNDKMGKMAYAQFPNVKAATFAVIDKMISMILPDSLLEEVGAYTQVEFVGWGDTAKFELENGALYDVYLLGEDRTHVESQTDYYNEITLNAVNHAVTVGAQWYKILTGEMDISKFIFKASTSLVNQMALDAYITMNTAMSALEGTAGDTQLKISGYTQDAAVGLAQKVESWNGNAYTVFAGTKRALANILPDDSNYRYDIQSPFVTVGYLRTVSGYDLFEMEQKANWKKEFALQLDDKKIYIMSPGADKIVKMVVEGQTVTNLDVASMSADFSQDATIMGRWKTANITNAIAGLIELP